MVGDQIDVKVPFESNIEQSLIVLEPHLGNWILVNFEGTSLNLSMIFFSIISNIFINIHEYGYKIICISNHQLKLLCPGINLVPSSVFWDKMLLKYEYVCRCTPLFLKVG